MHVYREKLTYEMYRKILSAFSGSSLFSCLWCYVQNNVFDPSFLKVTALQLSMSMKHQFGTILPFNSVCPKTENKVEFLPFGTCVSLYVFCTFYLCHEGYQILKSAISRRLQ